jgi:hypothetical protein
MNDSMTRILKSVLLIAVFWGVIPHDAHSASTTAYVNIPDTLIKYPESGQIIWAGITIEVKNREDVHIFENSQHKIASAMASVARNFKYEKVAIPLDRGDYDRALKKAVSDLVRNESFSILFNKLDLFQMPLPNVKWFPMGGNYGDVTFYIDNASVTKQNHIARIWLLMDYQNPDDFQGKPYSSVVSLHEIDCSQSRSRKLLATAYELKQAKGGNVHESDFVEQWTPIQTGTVFVKAQHRVCK